MRHRVRAYSIVLSICPGLPWALGGGLVFADPVVNPDFEAFTSCPTQHSQIAFVPPWYSPTDGSPDYFHTCGSGTGDVPSNLWGSQLPFDGEAYAGVIAYNSLTLEREYIQEPLAQSLVIGATYQVSLRVSLGDNSMWAGDRFGISFHTGPVTQVGNTPLPLTPQVENPANDFLTDVLGWTEISGSFVAAANHDYVTLGNFEDDSNTQVVSAGGTTPGAIYYIDGIEVAGEPCPGLLIDYESALHTDALDTATSNPHTEDGMRTWPLSGLDPHTFGTQHPSFNDSTAVHSDQIIFTRDDGTPTVPGSAFTLHWMEISEFEPLQSPTVIEFTATKPNLTTVSQNVNLDGDGSLGKQLFHFPAFDNVVKVESFPFPAPPMQIDNVCITLLPMIAPSLSPFFLGLLALLLVAAALRASKPSI